MKKPKKGQIEAIEEINNKEKYWPAFIFFSRASKSRFTEKHGKDLKIICVFS